MAIFGVNAGGKEGVVRELEDELLNLFLAVLGAVRTAVPARFLPGKESLEARRALPARPLECLRWLALPDPLASPEARALTSFLAREGTAFRWGQTYGAGDFGTEFLRNYGWLEVFGSRGHFVHEEIAGGLLLLGPRTSYPDHRHTAEEIYIPLTGGSEWRMAEEPFRMRAAGEIIHHASNVSHAMRTGAQPLLALYLWRGGPLDQKSEIGWTPQAPSQARNG